MSNKKYTLSGFDFIDEQTAEIQKARKLVHYTITDLGEGPQALAAWKADRLEIERAYNFSKEPQRQATRLKAMAIVAEQDPTLKLSDEDKIQLDVLSRRGAFALHRAKVDAESAKINHKSFDWNTLETSEYSLKDKIKNYIKKALFPDSE